jgi:hypothetical protein
MSEERIDIVATDKIDASIPQKLGQIADGAERAESYLKRLQAALAAINGTAIDRLASAMAKADAAAAQLISAQARLVNAQNNSALSAEKVALAQQKIATEAARTQAAQAKAAAATTTAELAAMRLAAAQTKAAGASSAAAAGAGAAATETMAEAAAMNAASGAANGMAGAANAAAGANNKLASSASGVAGAAGKMNAGYGNSVNAANQYARAARNANFVNANIIAQMQDIGVSLAGGQNPLLVLIQQGSQLSYIASTLQGGWTALLGIVGRMLLGFAPLIVVLGLLAGAFESVKSAAEDMDPAGQKFIATLGLTHKEIERLKDTSVTWGDTFGGVMDTIADRLGTTTANMKKWFSDAFASIVDFCKFSVALIYGFFYAGVKTIIADWSLLPAAIGGAAIGAANLALKAITGLINSGSDLINEFIHYVNEKLGTNIGDLGHVAAAQFANPWSEQAKKVGDDWVKNLHEGMDQAYRLAEDSAAAADKRRQARLRAQRDKIVADRTPKKEPKEKVDHTAEKRAAAIAAVNLKLDDELARMHMLKDQREIQQRMDQIEEGLAGKKIKLSDDERAAILAKVTAIQDYKRVQEQMDRIYSEITEPAKTYAAALQAITELQGKGVITAKQATEQTNLAKDAFAQATDKLYDFKRAIEADTIAAGLYGKAADQNTYYQSLRNSEFGKANALSPIYVAGVNAEVDALMRQNNALLQQQQIKASIAPIVDPLIQQQNEVANKQAEYDAIAKLERAGVLNHGNAMTARFQLDQKYSQQSLQNWGNFFGNLATLQSSGNKKLALIGKAAAVAQATMQGVQAVQNALATPAPWPLPLVFAAAAGVAAAMNVAKIISTPVGNYATGGQFMVQGRSGIDANNISMNVTRGERVTVETAAQQRANDNPSPGPALPPVVKVVNVTDPRDLVAALDTNEGEHKVLNIIQNNPDVLRRILG